MTETNRKSTSYWIHSIIVLAWMIGFGLLPPIEPLSQYGMKILGIFIGSLWGWTFVEMIWPSLFGMVVLSFTDYGNIITIFSDGFGDSVTLQVLFMLLFAAYLDMSGLNKHIAYWFISRKIAIGRPWVLSFLIFLAAYLLSMAVDAVPVIVLLWNIFYNVCHITGYTKEDKYTKIMVAGIVFTSILGVTVLPIKAFTIIVLNAFSTASNGMTVDFLGFSLTNICITSVAFAVWMLVCKYVFKPDVSRLSGQQDFFGEYRNNKMTTEQKIASVFLFLFIFLLVIPSIFPKEWAWVSVINSWGILGVSAILVTACTFLRYKSEPLAKFAVIAHKGISWDVILLLAATMPVCTAMESSEAGVMDFLVSILTPIFSSMSPLAFTLIFSAIGGIVTQVSHNIVCGVVFTPITYKLAL